MKRAVFFDRDNTLIVNDVYLADPDKVVLVDGAARAVARARRMGFLVVTVSNQGGVGKGLMSESDVEAVDDRLQLMLLADDPMAVIDRREFCPDHPEAVIEQFRRESDRRKPAPGMILDASRLLGVDPARSWMVGDTPRDIEAGKRAGCRTVLLRDPRILNASPEASKPGKVEPDYIASSLEDAMDFIEMHAGDARSPASGDPALGRIEAQLDRLTTEVRRLGEPTRGFGAGLLLAGVLQGLAVVAAVAAMVLRDNHDLTVQLLLGAILLEAGVIAAVVCSR
jgi:D-glycero-D-manno-heptose 1,7-bisphosphate phosphatase